MEVENSAYKGALTTPSMMRDSKFVPECKLSWTDSRYFEPFSDSFQNLYIAHEGIIEAGSVEEDQTIAFEVWKTRNGNDICGVRFRSTRRRVIADFHLFCPGDVVNELQAW